jgi:hypothetical protein
MAEGEDNMPMLVDIEQLGRALLARKDSVYAAVLEFCAAYQGTMTVEDASGIANEAARGYSGYVKDVLQQFGWNAMEGERTS